MPGALKETDFETEPGGPRPGGEEGGGREAGAGVGGGEEAGEQIQLLHPGSS